MKDPGTASSDLNAMTASLSQWPLWSLVLLCILLLSQGLFLFWDGRKHGVRHYWVWALWGLTTCPLPSILYWFLVRKKHK